MAEKEKNFNSKLYAIITFIVIASLLVIICFTTFKSKYTAFHPAELARSYVDSIVQTGDGYNAYKNTLASKSSKYGDYIREYYIYPAVYRDTDYKIGESTDDYKGYNDDSYMSDATANDDGTLNGQLINAMYSYYEELVLTYGWDDYDSIYTLYLDRLIEVRQEIFGDSYLTDDIFFAAFESNVSTYGDKLTGTDDEFDENTGVQLTYKSTGVYQELFGEDYKLQTTAGDENALDIDEYKSSVDADVFATYGVSVDDIDAAEEISVTVSTSNGTTVALVNVVVVKIGSSWYVDNTTTDTNALYGFYTLG